MSDTLIVALNAALLFALSINLWLTLRLRLRRQVGSRRTASIAERDAI